MLRKAWDRWKRVGQFIGDIIARVVLSLFYFTIFVPFGIGVRLWSDPLGTKRKRRESLWLSRQTNNLGLDDARRQF